MSESSFNLSELKLALKRRGLAGKKYKLVNTNSCYISGEYIPFMDIVNESKVTGKIVTSSSERNHWPLLNHENVAPVFDVLNIRRDLNVFITIDIQVKLKDIIHNEDFVYNSRCFVRKKAYAKGIFSGLSYIHSKSLCLMNLSDDNIYICMDHDRAVITNFSFMSGSSKTTRNKLKVLEHYKAPETEKQDFDATAAEMWASGTLMLDLFLSHMVPWAVIDYKPRRVLEMVNKLSLDLLQAANAGSVVTDPDLFHFKTFLKRFFDESQSRITASLASIASFLSVKSQNNKSSPRTFNLNCNCSSQETEQKYPISVKNPLEEVIPKTDTNPSSFRENNSSTDIRLQEYFDYNESSAEICVDSETPNCLISNVSSDSNSSEIEESFSTVRTSSNWSFPDFNEEKKDTVRTEIDVKNNGEITCDKQVETHEKTPYSPEDQTDSFSTSKMVLNKTFKSCQMIKKETNEFKFNQSQSLTLTNLDNISCETSVKISCNKNLCQASLPLRKLNESDFEKSNLGLDRLFENKESFNDSMITKKVSHKVSNLANTKDLHKSFDDFTMYELKNQKNFYRKYLPQTEIRLSSRDSRTIFNDKMSIKRVKMRFKALSKAEVSLKDHKPLFISEELSEKQQSLINEYLDLLRQEKIQLCEILSNKYKLSMSEVEKICESFASRPRYNKKINIRSVSNELQFSSSEFSDCKLADTDESGKNPSRTTKHKKFGESEDGLKLKPLKRFSYCKAIESSVNQAHLQKRSDRLAEKMKKDPELENKLISTEIKAELSEAQNRPKTANQKVKGPQGPQDTKNLNSHLPNQSLEHSTFQVNLKDSKELLMAKKEKKKVQSDKDTIPLGVKKTKINRKPLCFSLCLGGRVEESSSSFYDLCEACKLGYEPF